VTASSVCDVPRIAICPVAGVRHPTKTQAPIHREPDNFLVRPLRSIFSSRPQMASAVARRDGQDRPSFRHRHILGTARPRLERREHDGRLNLAGDAGGALRRTGIIATSVVDFGNDGGFAEGFAGARVDFGQRQIDPSTRRVDGSRRADQVAKFFVAEFE
jgi:hypothetical protein